MSDFVSVIGMSSDVQAQTDVFTPVCYLPFFPHNIQFCDCNL